MHPQGRARVVFNEIVEICTVGVVNLVVLACVLRTTTKKRKKKIVNVLGEENCTPRENPVYTYNIVLFC